MPVKPLIILLLFVCLSPYKVQGQLSTCIEDFENGTLTSWSACTAHNTGISNFVSNSVTFTQPVADDQDTIVTAIHDPVEWSINRAHSGYYALRLGNSTVGAIAERVSRKVTVTSPCFSFWYALIFQEPNHKPNEQPFFMFRVLDSNGTVIHSYIRRAANDTFFKKQPGTSVVYRDWTQYNVDLGAYEGQTVTLEFTNSDCQLSEHYGYTYIDDICFAACCQTCEDVINLPQLYSPYPVLVYKGSIRNICCYSLNFPFVVADVFKCGVYGIKIYEEGKPNSPVSSYQGSIDVDRPGFNQHQLDFCLDNTTYTTTKTFVIALYDAAGNLICDSIKRTIEPCASQSGCNCNNLFADQQFANIPVITNTSGTKPTPEDTINTSCCFTFNPFRDSGVIKCPYYGFKIYKDSNAHIGGFMFLNILSPTPLGGPGSSYTPAELYKFCIGNYLLADGMRVRIEYLDSAGKVICSTTQKLSCGVDCCGDIAIHKMYRGSNAEGMYINCCWDITATLPPGNGCPYYFPMMYNEGQTPSPTIMLPSYMWHPFIGTYCTESYLNPVVYLPVGGSATVTKYLKKTLAIYDSTGKLLCTKLIEDSCTRTFTVERTRGIGFQGLMVSPNPFTNTFTMQMELQQATAIEAKVFNSKGEEVWKHNYGEQPAGTFIKDIDLRGLPAGIYALSVNNGMAIAQIMKE